MKKILLFLVVCCALSACFYEYDNDEIEIQNEEQDETEKIFLEKTDTLEDTDSTFVYDDDDESSCILIKHRESEDKWYFEPISIGNQKSGIIHSKFDCQAVKNGVIPNICFPECRFRHSFCTKCMNDELAQKWYKWYEEGPQYAHRNPFNIFDAMSDLDE